jgi:hypothetical protein
MVDINEIKKKNKNRVSSESELKSCPSQFSYQMMFMSFSSSNACDTSGAGTAYPSRVQPQFFVGLGYLMPLSTSF